MFIFDIWLQFYLTIISLVRFRRRLWFVLLTSAAWRGPLQELDQPH